MKLKKQLAIITLIVLILNILCPNFSLFKSSVRAATTGVLEAKPLIFNNLGIENKGANRMLVLELAYVSEQTIKGTDFHFKIDTTKIVPANKNTGAAMNVIGMITTQSDYYQGTFQAKTYTPSTNEFVITTLEPTGGFNALDNGYIPGGMGDPAIDDNGAGYPAYYPLMKFYFKVVDNSLTAENLVLDDLIQQEPYTGCTTGLQVAYVNSSGIDAYSDINIAGKGFVESGKTVTGIAVKTQPTKSTYDHGDAVNLAGGEITVTYDDGSTDVVSMTDSKVKVNSGTPADVSNPKVNIEYSGQTCDVNLTVNDPVDSLAVTNPMNKTNYDEGENFSFSGLQLTATKRSGATVNLTQSSTGVTTSETVASITSSNFTKTSPAGDLVTKGIQKIIFTYEGKTANTSVVVNDAITGIDLISQPTKQIYKRGEALNLAGAKVEITLQSGNNAIVNLPDGLVTVGSYNPNTTGSQQNLSVRVGTYTSPTTIDVEAYNYITSHTLTAPTKSVYEYGDTLNLNGGRLRFTWQSGTGPVNQLNLTDPGVTVTGYSPTTIGVQNITVTYIATYTLSDGTPINDTITDSFSIVLTNPVTNIDITAPTKTAYKHGESLALADGVIEVTYKDGSKLNPTMIATMVTESDGTAVNMSPAATAYTANSLSKTLKITYSEDSKTKTINYPITIENYINLIGMSSNPTKTTYNLGDTTYDLTGGDILVAYAAGNTTTVPLSDSGVSLTPLNTLTGTTGTKTVQVSYGGKTTSFNINVQNGVTGITITTPTDVTFNHGDALTFTGGSIDVEHADGTHTYPTITSAIVTETATGSAVNMSPSASDYNTSTHDLTKNLTITYTESGVTQTATYNITLNNPVDSIAFGTAPATSYNLYDSISYPIGDLIITRKAGDVDPTPVNITSTMVTGLSAATAGTGLTATVSYGGKTLTYNYDVIDNVTGIVITVPTTTNYNHGDPINFTGADIDVTYASGTHSHPTMTLAMLTEAGGGAVNMSPSSTAYDANYELNKTLTITYTENGVTQTASYPITLKNNVTGIAMGTLPSDRNYKINDTAYKVSDGDIIVTRAAGNNHTVGLTNASVSLTPISTITNTAGTKTVDVGYEGETTSFTVTVVNAVDTITITAPTDVTFEHGDTLTFGGGDIYITYLDGTDRHETMTSAYVLETSTGSAVNMSPATTDYNATTHELTKNLTIRYTEDGKTQTKSYNITISNPVDSIAVTSAPRGSYNLNDTPTYPDGTITATRKAGDTEGPVAITQTMVTGLDTTSAGTGKTATVTYEGKSTTYTYDVIDNVTSIVITPPTQATYNHGDPLNLAGSDILVTYAGGSTNNVTMTTAMITNSDGTAVSMSPAVTDYNANHEVSKTLKIEYTENGVSQTAYYPITIKNNVTGIAMGTNPTKTTYELNDSTYDLTGGDIIVTRAVGPTEVVALTDSGITLTPLNTLTAATGTSIPVTVTYEGQSTSFDIDVIDGLISINISGTPKTVYELNEAIDPTLSIDVVRGSGTTTIPVTSSMISGFDTTTVGSKTAIITYDGLTTNYTYNVTDDEVSIAMGTTPKTNYLVGDSLDVTGGTIIVTKKSGATDTVTIAPTMVSGFSSASVVTGQTLTVTYNGLTTTYQINVTNPVSSITLNPGPTKTTYKYGEGLDLTGAYIDVVFENGSTDRMAVTSSMVSGYDPTTLGPQTVTVTYGTNLAGANVTDTFTVTVNDYVTGITVTGEKTNYNYGDALDLTVGSVEPIMASGTPATPIDLDDPSVTVSGYSATTVGSQTLTVVYGTESTTFNVNVQDYVATTSITVPTQTTYNYGDSLDLSTGSIVQTMASGTTNTLPLAISMVTESDGTPVDMTPSTFGTNNTVTKTLLITDSGVTANYPITIVNDIKSITIKQTPKQNYKYGDSIDTSVGSVEVTRGNGQTEEIMLSDPRITIDGFDTTTPINNIPVTVKLTENGVTKQTTYTIDVNDDISSIQLVGTPKTTYKYGESLDLSGLTLTVVRPSGTTPNVPVTASMTSGYNPNTLGNQTITITYGDKTATYVVNVEDYLKDIELVKPTKVTYKKGETLDLTGASITEVMASGAKVTGVAVTSSMVSSLDTTTEGAKTLTVTYTKDGKTFNKQFVVVVQDGLSGITVKDFPNDEYLYGEALNLTGATLEVELESGEKSIVPITNSMVSGYTVKPSKNKFDDSDEYIQVITISYTKDGKTQTTTYPVTMKDYLEGIVVENLQDEYTYGDDLNVDGATVAKVMASGNTKDKVQLTKDMVSGYNPNKEGDQVLTITYAGKTAKETVTVVDNVVAISIKKEPNKKTYDYGTALDLTGAKLEVTKNSGKYLIDITDDMVSGYDSNKEGTQTITVTYVGFEAEFSVKVLPKPVTPVSDDTPEETSTPATPITRVVTRVVTVNEEPEEEQIPEEPVKQEPVVQTKPAQTTKVVTEKPTQTLGVKDEQQNNGLDIVKVIAGIIAILGLLVLLFLLFFKHNVKVFVEEDGEFVLGGLDKLSKNNPKLDIDHFLDEETYPNRVKVHLNDSISEKLDGIEIEITHRGQTIKHKVHYKDEPYEFILDAISKVEEKKKEIK